MRLFTLLFLLVISLTANTQNKISDKTKNMKRYDGFFTFWWDDNNGKIWLQIDQFDKEFLYVTPYPPVWARMI